MSLLKRAAAIIFAAVLACAACACLVGCGKDAAATWKNGTISEESVTTTIENMRTYYGLTDDEAWAAFLKERTYTEQGDAAMTATEKAIANITPKDESAKANDGTAEDLRAYIIEQMIRSQIIQDEIKSRNIEVSEEEVNQYVEQQRAYIESRLMEGVFESVLQRQGYENLEAYKKEIREQLKQLKLQTEVAKGNDESDVSGKDAWNAWFDSMYEKANVKINPAPSSLSYAIVEGSSE